MILRASNVTRIGIIGSDSSHAIKFSKLINSSENSPFKVVSIFGLDKERTEEVAHAGRIERIVSAPEDMDVDAIMVLFRDGNLHREYAMPFIKAGIPVFVDKPFAIKLEDCEAMIEEAKRSGTLLTSYSTVRYVKDLVNLVNDVKDFGELQWGMVGGPCDFCGPYGGPYFYGTHTIEMMLTLFGYDIKGISAKISGSNVVATVRYEGGALVVVNLLGPHIQTVFFAGVAGENGSALTKVDISTCYADGLVVFLDMLKSRSLPLAYEQLLTPIKVLTLLEKALALGKDIEFE